MSLVLSLVGIQNVEAFPTVMIYTDKNQYSFGDYLSTTIEVSNVTGEFAVLHITDKFGKKSSPINIKVNGPKTTITAPFPFDPAIYIEGTYNIDVEYSGTVNSTEFTVIDSGIIVIPYWIKDFARYWFDGAISDNEFVKGIQFLIKEEIIVIPETQSQEKNTEVKIPEWIKTNTKWWIEGKISDNDYALGLQHLIKIKIVVV